MEVTDITAFCLWFALHIPSYTLCQYQDTRILLQPGICSHNQGKKAAWRLHRIHGEAGAPPHGGFAHSSSPQGRGQPGERCALRSSGQLWSRCRALGSVPLEEERRCYLLRKTFIRCDLVKVTIFTLLNYNKVHKRYFILGLGPNYLPLNHRAHIA